MNGFRIKNDLQVAGTINAGGSITGVTEPSQDNSAKLSSTAWVRTHVAGIVGSAPATLDTLNELAAALGNDPNFATTVANNIAGKQNQLNGTGFVKISGTNISYDNNTYLTSINSSQVISALGYTPYNASNPSGYTANTGTVTSVAGAGTVSGLTLTGTITTSGSLTLGGSLTLTSLQITTGLGFTPYNASNPSGYITGITSGMVTTALGFTPYNSSNPAGYITGISFANVSAKPTTIAGYGITDAYPLSGNPSGFLTGITSGQVTSALGFTPYNSTNPSGYISQSAADGRYLMGTTSPSSVNNFTISIGNNGSYSYVQSHSSQPLELNPLGNTVRIAGNIVWHQGNLTNLNQLSNGPGYITGFTETDPTVPAHVKAITTTNISNWNTAHSWGNHAVQGYASQGYVNTAIANVVAKSGDTMTGALTLNGGLNAYAAPIFVNEIRFRDTSGSPHSDPYSIRWISEASTRGAGFSWLEFQLNDDNNEEIRIYGNSCVNHGCGTYSDNLYHRFRADGYAWHAGNLEVAGTFSASGYNKSNWDTAFGWGNHASAGYASASSLANYLPLAGGTMTGNITITSADIRSNAASGWTGDPGTQGKIQYHSNRWYIVADQNSDRIVQFRRNGTDTSWIDNNGVYQGNISGNAGSVSGLTLNSSSSPINPDNVTQNQIGYNTSVNLYGQTDGGLYSSAFSSAWIHQIYGDFRTGQIAIRGKNSGTWQAWRMVLDSGNFTSYAPSLTGGGASGTWGISISGNAATINSNPGRTDSALYPVVWSNGSTQSPNYSCAAVVIQSSTGTLFATRMESGQYMFPGTSFNPSAGPRTTTEPMSIKMWNNYFNGTGLGSDYGTVMEYYSMGSHVTTQVYFDAGGGSWYRSSAYNQGWQSWQRYVTDNGGTYNINISGLAGDSTNLGGRSSFRYLYYRGYTSSGDFQTLQSTVNTLRFDQVGVINNWSNAPGGVYTYGGVLSLRGENFSLQLYGSHTGDLVFKTQWDNDQHSGWRNIIHSGNIGSQSVSYANSAGSISNQANSATITAATAATANTIALRDSAGDIAVREIVLNSGLSGVVPTVLVSMFPTTNQLVRTTPAAVAAALSGQSMNINGNATSASSVAWSGVSSKPADWLNQTNLILDNDPNTAQPSGFYQNIGSANNPTGTWMNYVNVRHSNPGNVHGYQIGMSYYDNNLWFRSYQGSGTYQSWVYALSNQNFNNFAPTLTGGGASGTWGINVTGTAGSETLATVVGRGASTTTSTTLGGGVTLGSRTNSSTYGGNAAGLALNSVAELRVSSGSNPPALTFHYENVATRHILLNSSGTLNVVSPTTENSGVAILAVNGNQVLHAGNVSSYALPIGGGTLTGNRTIQFDTGGGATIVTANAGGWSMGTYYRGSSGTTLAGFGAYGEFNSLAWAWIGPGFESPWITFNSSAVNSQVALQQGGNQVLHAGNFTSYAPSLTGVGASGTWGINITGNAGTATNSTQLGGADSSRFIIGGSGARRGVNQISNWNQGDFPDVAFLSSESSITNAPNSDFTYGLQYAFHRSGAAYRTQIVTSLYSDSTIWVRNSRDSDVWTSWKTLWHSGNLTNLNQLTNGPGYITSSALSSYLPLSGGTMSGDIILPNNTSVSLRNADGSAGFRPDDQWGNIYTWNMSGGYYVDANSYFFRSTGGSNWLTISNGNGSFSGSVTATAFFASSDIRLKDIIAHDGDMITYKWKDGRDDKIHYGYSAQNLQSINANLVNKNLDGFLSVNYTETLVLKVRELEKQVELLKAQIN